MGGVKTSSCKNAWTKMVCRRLRVSSSQKAALAQSSDQCREGEQKLRAVMWCRYDQACSASFPGHEVILCVSIFNNWDAVRVRTPQQHNFVNEYFSIFFETSRAILLAHT